MRMHLAEEGEHRRVWREERKNENECRQALRAMGLSNRKGLESPIHFPEYGKC